MKVFLHYGSMVYESTIPNSNMGPRDLRRRSSTSQILNLINTITPKSIRAGSSNLVQGFGLTGKQIETNLINIKFFIPVVSDLGLSWHHISSGRIADSGSWL